MEVYHSLKQEWNLGHVKMIPQCTKGHYFNLPDAQAIKYHTFIFDFYLDLEKRKQSMFLGNCNTCTTAFDQMNHVKSFI